jgi:hypothetical protein
MELLGSGSGSGSGSGLSFFYLFSKGKGIVKLTPYELLSISSSYPFRYLRDDLCHLLCGCNSCSGRLVLLRLVSHLEQSRPSRFLGFTLCPYFLELFQASAESLGVLLQLINHRKLTTQTWIS